MRSAPTGGEVDTGHHAGRGLRGPPVGHEAGALRDEGARRLAGAAARPGPPRAPGRSIGRLEQPTGMRVGKDVGQDPGQQLVADAVGVTADATAAPAHDGTADHVAGRLVPVGGDPADHGVVFRDNRACRPRRRATRRRRCRTRDRRRRLEHDQRVTGDRRMHVCALSHCIASEDGRSWVSARHIRPRATARPPRSPAFASPTSIDGRPRPWPAGLPSSARPRSSCLRSTA